jgi:hypothetical protein
MMSVAIKTFAAVFEFVSLHKNSTYDTESSIQE